MNDLTDYRRWAPLMRPGDVIAFSGRAAISYLIDLFSGSDVSHVGMVRTPATDQRDVMITESTIQGGVSGPQTHALGEVLANYGNGAAAWWLPLSPDVRKLADWSAFEQFVTAEEGKIRYDVPGLFGFLARSLPVIGPRICQSESARRMFCSAWDTAIFEACGVLRGINWSKTSPQDLCEMKLYGDCLQLMGMKRAIRNFNRW